MRNISNETLMMALVCFVVCLVVLGIIAKVMSCVVKNQDNKLPKEQKRGKIIEKIQMQTNQVYWVTVEFKDGERKKLRVFGQTLILKEGDEGVIEYQGQTIKSFRREK